MSVILKSNECDAPELDLSWLFRKMIEEAAFLLSQPEMPFAGVYRKCGSQNSELNMLGKIPRASLERIYVLGWVGLKKNGDIEIYELTTQGRMAHEAERTSHVPSSPRRQKPKLMEEPAVRGGSVQTPLEILARKKDRNGVRFLNIRAQRAAEQLIEDYHIGEIDERVTQVWNNFLEDYAEIDEQNPSAKLYARHRFACAMLELGEGLGDIVYRVCCLQEGLETAETLLGWSARSGKVVLRIALLRLADFYQIPDLPNRD